MIEPRHLENLTKLMNYLRSLPEDYKEFDMGGFYLDKYGDSVMLEEATIPECGSVACAVGHGIAAGVANTNSKEWSEYAEYSFSTEKIAWIYLFSASWECYDNTHYGAADRIEKYIALDGEITDDIIPWR